MATYTFGGHPIGPVQYRKRRYFLATEISAALDGEPQSLVLRILKNLGFVERVHYVCSASKGMLLTREGVLRVLLKERRPVGTWLYRFLSNNEWLGVA